MGEFPTVRRAEKITTVASFEGLGHQNFAKPQDISTNTREKGCKGRKISKLCAEISGACEWHGDPVVVVACTYISCSSAP